MPSKAAPEAGVLLELRRFYSSKPEAGVVCFYSSSGCDSGYSVYLAMIKGVWLKYSHIKFKYEV